MTFVQIKHMCLYCYNGSFLGPWPFATIIHSVKLDCIYHMLSLIWYRDVCLHPSCRYESSKRINYFNFRPHGNHCLISHFPQLKPDKYMFQWGLLSTWLYKIRYIFVKQEDVQVCVVQLYFIWVNREQRNIFAFYYKHTLNESGMVLI